MKLQIGDILQYKDDGGYPSLDGKECELVGYDNHLGIKWLVVEFILENGKKFQGSIYYKNFKKIKGISEVSKRSNRWNFWG